MTGLHTAILALALTGAGTDEPVLLDFSATWCGPCRQMVPVIDRLQAEGYPIKKLDYDRHRDLARQYGVDQIPCFVMTVDGQETGRVLGVVPAEQLEKMFSDARKQVRPKVLPEPRELPLHNVKKLGSQVDSLACPEGRRCPRAGISAQRACRSHQFRSVWLQRKGHVPRSPMQT